ncbi:hypothetical protein P3T20_002708 [Paraburkholderia sp. GAS206C]|uniref:hypothetical protein n=1 Tax=unclassified Paraburkholderia TaxID=2615204 RepID=UPI003D1F1BBF
MDYLSLRGLKTERWLQCGDLDYCRWKMATGSPQVRTKHEVFFCFGDAIFDFSKSNTEAEKAICSSIELSTSDRSVSQAYKPAQSQYRGAGNDVRSLTPEKNGLRNAMNVTQTGIVSFPQ